MATIVFGIVIGGVVLFILRILAGIVLELIER
jgi:hypothetical protein